MMVLPGESAVMVPVALTVATLGRLELQATDLPDSTLPCASSGSATSCAVWPTVRSRLEGRGDGRDRSMRGLERIFAAGHAGDGNRRRQR